MSIKHRITEVRRERGVTQGQLAERLGATQSMIGKLERGERIMTFNWISRIAEALNVEPADLLDATDEPAKIGQISADGLIKSDGHPQLWAPPSDMPPDLLGRERLSVSKVGVELEDDATLRIPSGSLLIYEGAPIRPTAELTGRLVVAWTTEKPLTEQQAYVHVVGVLMPGSDSGLFHLIPFNGRPLTNIPVHFACEITEIRMRMH